MTRNQIESLVVRAEAVGPAPEHVTDGHYRFAVDYVCDGHSYSFSLWARDAAEADRHCAALRRSAFVAGQIYAEGMA